jgi:hypothetical protein
MNNMKQSEMYRSWSAVRWTSNEVTSVVIDDAAALTGKRVIAECDSEDEARLIAAAPDLLMACERLFNEVQWESMRADIVTDEARANLVFAREAMRKATGRPEILSNYVCDPWGEVLKNARIDGWADYDEALAAACIEVGIPDAQYESLCVALEAMQEAKPPVNQAQNSKRYNWIRAPENANLVYAMIGAGECETNLDSAIDATMGVQK